jgi:hypothetical protein
VKLKYLIFGNACLLMQGVDVLRDHAISLPHLVKLGGSIMGSIRFGLGEESGFCIHLPMYQASLTTAEKPVNSEVLGIVSGPDPSRAAEIGYT